MYKRQKSYAESNPTECRDGKRVSIAHRARIRTFVGSLNPPWPVLAAVLDS